MMQWTDGEKTITLPTGAYPLELGWYPKGDSE